MRYPNSHNITLNLTHTEYIALLDVAEHLGCNLKSLLYKFVDLSVDLNKEIHKKKRLDE